MVNPLTPNLMHLFDTEPLTGSTNRLTSTGRFGDIFSESLKAAGRADLVDKASTAQLVMGEADDLSGMLIDMQKAELSLQLALQIRNKIIDAYNEVMRMSV